MPQARKWTDDADQAIRDGRSAGMTWAELGRALGLSRNTVIERGRRLRVCAGEASKLARRERLAAEKAAGEGERGLTMHDRPPLPAGSFETWGVISAGPYPYWLMGIPHAVALR